MLPERGRAVWRATFLSGGDRLTKCILTANQFQRLAVFVADLAISRDGIPPGAYPDVDKLSDALADETMFVDEHGEKWWVLLNSLFQEFAKNYVDAHELLEPYEFFLKDVCKSLTPNNPDFTASSYAHDALESLWDLWDQVLRIAAGQEAVGVAEFQGRTFEVIALTEENFETVCAHFCAYLPVMDWQPVLDRIAWQFREVESQFDLIEEFADVEGDSDGEKTNRRPAYERDHLWLDWHLNDDLKEAGIRDKWNELTDEERKEICPGCWGSIPLDVDKNGRGTVSTAIKKAKGERNIS